MLSRVWLFETLGTVAHKALLSMGFSSKEYWSGLPLPPPQDLPDPEIKPTSPVSPALQADSLPLESWRKTKRLACQEWDSNLHLQERLGPECSTLDYYTCSAILKGLSQGQMAHKLKNQIQILSQIHSAFRNFYLSLPYWLSIMLSSKAVITLLFSGFQSWGNNRKATKVLQYNDNRSFIHSCNIYLVSALSVKVLARNSIQVFNRRVQQKWKSLSPVRLFATPWTMQSMEFSRPEYWSG